MNILTSVYYREISIKGEFKLNVAWKLLISLEKVAKTKKGNFARFYFVSVAFLAAFYNFAVVVLLKKVTMVVSLYIIILRLSLSSCKSVKPLKKWMTKLFFNIATGFKKVHLKRNQGFSNYVSRHPVNFHLQLKFYSLLKPSKIVIGFESFSTIYFC